jgi:hypothetical protein
MNQTRTAENDYGCTRYDGVTDMAGGNTLIDQLKENYVPYETTTLSMGTLTAEPASIVTFVDKKSNSPMTVLVIPMAGADSWAEDYYYFPFLTHQEAQQMDWPVVYEHVHTVSWETIRRHISHPTPCPQCGHLDVFKSDSYKDIRANIRCSYCHGIRIQA